ncbi:MAG TPA: DUF6744 family protein, partial [Blastocatellia bacterium]|nr:DUF6744 family protein [Blastocatellia bacterium]
IRDLNGLEAATSQLPLIGFTVLWRLEGIRVSHPDLEQALQAAGFEKYLPDPPTPRVALRRALAEWIKTKQRTAQTLQFQPWVEDQEENGGGRRRTLIRVIDRAGSEHLVYALVAEDIDFSALGLSYGTALRILLNKKTGEMICTTDAEGVIDAQRESQQLTDELMPYWRQYRDLFIARDLSQMVREIIGGMNAVSLRQAGGVYFVPESESDALFRLRQLIAGIPQTAGPGSFVCALGVPDAVEARRGLSKAVHAGLLDEINSLRSDLGRLGESGERLREKTVAQRLVIYKRLKAKAEMYQDLLGMRQDEIRAEIAGLEREAVNLLAADSVPLNSATSQPPATLFAESMLATV